MWHRTQQLDRYASVLAPYPLASQALVSQACELGTGNSLVSMLNAVIGPVDLGAVKSAICTALVPLFS